MAMLSQRATCLCLVAVAAVFLPTGLAAAPAPSYPCFRAAQAPTIDGEVAGDAGWEAVPGVTGFYVLGDGYTLAKQTTAFACYDDANLYVAMVCEEPDVALVQSVMRDGDGVWAEDSVEIFVEPVVHGPVYQFGISAGGARCGFAAATNDGGWEVAARKTERAYAVEAKFPFSLFASAPPAVAAYHVAFCRNIWVYDSGGDKFTSWPALIRQFNEPTSFATLAFQPGVVSAAQTERIEASLNAAYRESLVQKIAALLPEAQEYLPMLERAAADETSRWRSEGRRIIAQWRRLHRLSANAQQASLAELREAASSSTALRQASYDVAYRYLIDQLLADM